MVRKILTYSLSLILLLSCEVELSENQAQTFLKFYGSYLVDTGKDAVLNGNGGYAIAGTTEISDTASAMTLILTDKFGNPLNGYPKYYSIGGHCGVKSILKLNDGYLLCGYVQVDDNEGEYQEDIYIVRTTETGEERWHNQFGGVENENVNHAIIGNSGGFILAGYKEFNEEKDYWIFSISDAGDFIREVPPQPIPDTDDDMADYLIAVPGEGYLCVCTYDEDTYDGTNVFILSINNDMNSPYNLSLGSDYDDFGRCIIRESENSYYVLGNTENESTGRSEIRVYNLEMDGLRFLNSGELATIKSGFEDLLAERFVLTNPGRIAIIGSRIANEDYNMMLQFVDQGIEDNRVYYGERGAQIGSGIIRSEDGGLIMVGTNAFEGNSMISLLKVGSKGQL